MEIYSCTSSKTDLIWREQDKFRKTPVLFSQHNKTWLTVYKDVLNMVGTCENSFFRIQSPETYIFGICFAILATTGTVGNALGFIVFCQPEMKSVLNRVLASLCVVGALLGLIYLPLLIWDIFATSEAICRSSVPRTIFSVSLLGTATLNVCLVAYERYAILKGVIGVYGRFMNYKNIMTFIAISWILPATGLLMSYLVLLRSLGTVICLFYLFPFVVLAVIYVLLNTVIKRKEKKLQIHQQRLETDGRTTRKTIIDITSQCRHIKIAKKVTSLALYYFCCMVPITVAQVWKALIKYQILHRTRGYEVYYLITILVALSMICIHLLLYLLRYPDFQNSLRKVLRMKPLNKPIREI